MGGGEHQREDIRRMNQILAEATIFLSAGRIDAANMLLAQVENWLASQPQDESGEVLVVSRNH
jgi:hypothetical protein